MKLQTLFFILMIGLLGAVACASKTRLTDDGRKVKIVPKAQIPSDCEILGGVKGMNNEGSEELARVDLRNNTADMGAQYAIVQEVVPNGSEYTINGLAYKCK